MNDRLNEIVEERVRKRTSEFLAEKGILVEFVDPPVGVCLILATHPTVWDSVVWRCLPGTFHAVNSGALKRTGLPALDRQIALGISRMIPVNKNDPSKRRETYRDIAAKLDEGYRVVINPTGETATTNEIPNEDAVRIGGIIGSLRKSKVERVVPAVVWVLGEIERDGTIASGAKVKVFFGPNLRIDDLNLRSDIVRGDELKTRLIGAWKSVVKENHLAGSESG